MRKLLAITVLLIVAAANADSIAPRMVCGLDLWGGFGSHQSIVVRVDLNAETIVLESGPESARIVEQLDSLTKRNGVVQLVRILDSLNGSVWMLTVWTNFESRTGDGRIRFRARLSYHNPLRSDADQIAHEPDLSDVESYVGYCLPESD